MGFDGFIYPGLCNVEITAYSVNMEAMAETGLDMVQAKMNGRKYRKGINMVEGQIVFKESVKRIVSRYLKAEADEMLPPFYSIFTIFNVFIIENKEYMRYDSCIQLL